MALTGKVASCVVLAALAAGGCENTNFSWPTWGSPSAATPATAPATAPATPTPQSKKVRDLEADLASARSDNAIFKNRIDALTVRESQLADSLREQQFLVEQEEKQIQVLARAPGERDKYKAHCQDLEAQALRLETDYTQLLHAANAAGAKIPPRAVAPPPTSRPAVEPATRPSARSIVRPSTRPTTRPTSVPGAGKYEY